jgi:hypothetical protein
MKRSLVVHPLLITIYPILFLYTHSINLDLSTEFVRPALVVAAVVGMI